MESCGKKSSRKSTSYGRKSRKAIKPKAISYCSPKNSAGRNPFFHYLAYFRKRNKVKLCHLSSCKVALLAGRQWTNMSPEEREPFICAARSSSYTYRPRRKKVNYLLGNLQEYVAGGECQAQALWNLMRGMKSWQQHSVLNDRITK
ncbi:high mobility group B protein 5 [Drosophila serrata]|uniref:high mobility group B protein 5 n=1 Tax=Drosophila serrata TaxID=7274 RepID=UPI000A1D1535|nr:high mobility group B protein 5 [Drosophila serrata]KAH8389855.1 hypothetical protein KR200_002830 [Drosophila serrata]